VRSGAADGMPAAQGSPLTMSAADKLAALRPEEGHRTLAERAFAALHEAVVTGVLEPGERLPIEELAASLEMSPMPVREALRRLHSVGLVENIPHRGARVTELSIADLREVYDARLALEPVAVGHAAERFTEEEAVRSAELLQEHVEAYTHENMRAIWATHTAFHFSLYEAARSRWMMRLIHPLWESSERYRFALLPMRVSLDRRRLEHERILAACAERRPDDAARELHDHLARTANAIAVQMGGEELFALEDSVVAEPAES
jgi:DNA-binding GntR family transcriptional regulator